MKLRSMIDEGTALRARLLNEAEPLVRNGVFDGAEVAAVRAGQGHVDLADDLVAMGGMFDKAWSSIGGRTFITEAEVKRAKVLGTELFAALGMRDWGAPEQAPNRARRPGDNRAKAYTLLVTAYDQVRRGLSYLRWAEGDVEEIAPSLYKSRARATSEKVAENGRGSNGVEAAPTPAAPPVVEAVAAHSRSKSPWCSLKPRPDQHMLRSANLSRPTMTPTANDKLRALRDRLAALEPYPWSAVEAWVASARPLITAFYGPHLADFNAATATPRWYQAAVWFSGGGRSGEPPRSNLAQVEATAAREDPKRATAAKAMILAFLDGLLDLPSPEERSGHAKHALVHHHGDIIMSGDKFSASITGSTVGAISIGDHATSTGTVNIHHGPPTQAQHVAQVKAAQKALVDDDELDGLVREALSQFLRLARDIQVEQRGLADVQAQMKETLDDVWAQQTVKGMKPQVLPKGLEVVGALAKSDAMVEVVKKLVGG